MYEFNEKITMDDISKDILGFHIVIKNNIQNEFTCEFIIESDHDIFWSIDRKQTKTKCLTIEYNDIKFTHILNTINTEIIANDHISYHILRLVVSKLNINKDTWIKPNITLPNGTQDSINIGGLIFGTGSYSTTSGNPYSGSQYGTGKVGINKVSPTYTLDVSGSGNYTNGLTITGSTYITGLTNTSQTNVLTYDGLG